MHKLGHFLRDVNGYRELIVGGVKIGFDGGNSFIYTSFVELGIKIFELKD